MLRHIFLIVFIFLNYIPIASAEDWKEVGWWSVGPLNNDDENNCRIYADYESVGIEFYLDYSDASKEYYFEIISQNWKSLVDDEEYVLDVEFDQGEWTLDTTARIIVDENIKYFGLYARDNRSGIKEFVRDFQKSNSVKISFENNEVAHLNLKDTFRAVEELKACAKRQNTQTKINDPFANKTKPKQPLKLDPFR
ncbi:MAG: hypothetical protein ACON33_04590 [Candidatus Micropelagos thuwalensis]